jgi:hypothetical protein
MRAAGARTYPSRVMILLAAAVAAGLAQSTVTAAGPLEGLAARAAEEIKRIAAGHQVEVEVYAEPSGDITVSSAVQSLIQARLAHAFSTVDPRMRALCVVGRSGSLLRLAGRLVADPGGEELDVFSVSVEGGASLSPPADAPRVTLTSTRASQPLPGRVLDLAFIDGAGLVVLFDDAVTLNRWDGGSLRELDRRALAVTAAVRAPAGMIVSTYGEAAFWAATNLADGATLFSIDGERLVEMQHAAVLPLLEAPRGARFFPGTNLLEVDLAGLGPDPLLRAGGRGAWWAIAADGRLGFARKGWTDARVGSAAAQLSGDFVATTSPFLPGPDDTITLRDVSSMSPVLTVPVAGSITALGGEVVARKAMLAAATEKEGVHRLVVLELLFAE